MPGPEHPELDALEHEAELGRRIVVRVAKPLHPANQRLAEFLGAEVIVSDTFTDQGRRRLSGRREGHYTVPGPSFEQTDGPRTDWIDYRASKSRVFKRIDAGERVETCQGCGTEVDVADPVHAPNCSALNGSAKRADEWDANAVITAIRLWADRHDGQPPSSNDWKTTVAGYPRYAVVVRIFGSWNDGIEAAGFEPRPSGRQAALPEREPEAEHTGTTPKPVSQAVRADEPASRSENAGSKPGPKPKWTPDDVVAAIRRWHDEHGVVPSANDWRAVDESHPTQGTVMRMFGTWSAAVAAAGFEPRRRGGQTGVPRPRKKQKVSAKKAATSEKREVEPEGPVPSRSSDVEVARTPPVPLTAELLTDGDKPGWIERFTTEARRLERRAIAFQMIADGLTELLETDA